MSKIPDYDSEMIATDVSATAFFAAVATFFTGFLISNYSSYDVSVRVPIIFLVISTFSFLFTTNIFGNAMGEILSGNKKRAKKNAAVGTIISEFLGMYLLVLAIPLVINALAQDTFLRVAVFLVSSISLFSYSISRFSVIQRYIVNKYYRLLYSTVLVALSFLCFLAQSQDRLTYATASVIIILYLLVTTVIISTRKVHYSEAIE